MIEKFRPEFEAHMEAARRRRHEELLFDPISLASADHSGPTPLDSEAETPLRLEIVQD